LAVLTILNLGHFLCFVFHKDKLSVKVKFCVSLLCVCAILLSEAVPKMTYTLSGTTLNPTHSLSLIFRDIDIISLVIL